MALKLYNTMSRKKEEFKPLNPPNVGMYCCGPTVYNYAHIGNLRAYIVADLLRRMLIQKGFRLKHVMNITDVGHLTSDADQGEDKMLLSAKKEKKSVWDIAEFYTNAFFKDTKLLNIQKPDINCRATKHIKDMIGMNKKIENNGFAYFTGGNLYFDTGKLDDYGKLARLKLEELKEGARADKDPNKKNPADFVLWFTKSKFQDQEMKWDSPWGTGYPGWHIECSAMSSKYLGEQFDIHTGGIDHIPVHHTNEIAQAEAAFQKKPWVKYWLHNEFLVMDKGKMSKSAGGFIRLQTVIDKGFEPLAYRYLCLGTHYRKQLMFSWEALKGAANAYKSLKTRIAELKKQKTSLDQDNSKKAYLDSFTEYINDDLNIPRALALMHDMLRDEKLGSEEKLGLVKEFDQLFGLELLREQKTETPAEIEKLVEKREKARQEKDYQLADQLRDDIKKKGYAVKDTPKGAVVEKL